MLKFGALHVEGMEVMGLLRQEIRASEMLLAQNKERLAHFEEGMEHLLGITDPATIPDHYTKTPNTAGAQTQGLAGSVGNSATDAGAGVAGAESSIAQVQGDAAQAAN